MWVVLPFSTAHSLAFAWLISYEALGEIQNHLTRRLTPTAEPHAHSQESITNQIVTYETIK